MALELTPEQKKDQEVANRLRSLSFGIQTTTPTVVSKQPASPNIFTDIGSVLKEVPQAIADVPKKFIAGGVPRLFSDKPAPETYRQAFKQFGQNVEAGPFGSKALSTPEGMQNAALSFGAGGVAKAVKPVVKETVKSIEKTPVFEGLKDLSTSIVEKLKGRTTVSKQFISDLTKSSDVKLSEKNIINNVLESSPDNISVADFAKKVKSELLPLKRSITTGDPRMVTKGEDVLGTPHYESIVLPDELRGKVKDYQENIYQSPIKTSAGQTHFNNLQNKPENYFGHTRIEDMADNKTRRVIEVQSDLYQKGNLEKEGQEVNNAKELLELAKKNAPEDVKTYEYELKQAETRRQELAPLYQYNDPTAHFRMIREEIKKAAQDGKTKLQFPTGETAMKVEGLGDTQRWYHPFGWGTPVRIKPDELKIGSEVTEGTGDGTWIITDVLGDGKFKAIQKSEIERIGSLEKIKKMFPNDWQTMAETFDISGKIDTNNPIYKFYDKEVRKFLNKFGGKEIIDDKGVKWIEIPITKEQAKEPVQAFGKIKLKTLLAGAGATAAAQIFTDVNNKNK